MLHLFILTISPSLPPPPLADLNNIKFSAYRTAMKLRRVQKALRCTYRLLFMVKSEFQSVKFQQVKLSYGDLMISCGTFTYSIVEGAVGRQHITGKPFTQN